MCALVFDVQISDEYIATVLASLNFSQEIFSEFVQVVGATSAMDDANVLANVIAIVRSMSQLTFFHTRGIDIVCKHESGTGAGAPLADVFVSLIMARVLKSINMKLVDADIFGRVGCARPSIVSDAPYIHADFLGGASYVDDNSFAADGETPLIILTSVSPWIPL